MKRGLYVLCAVLLCLFPISVQAQDELILGGNSVGIEIDYEGVYVSGTYQISASIDPADTFRPGDIITALDHRPVSDLQSFYAILRTHQKSVNTIDVTIQRERQTIDTTMQSVYDDERHTVTCGLYIKESMSGVGTMTYYDPTTKRYGALGHAIEQVDSEIQGDLYDAQIVSFTKAQPSNAGAKQANIAYDEAIGTIDQNTPIGIYGAYTALPETTTQLEWATVDEVTLGEAEIYTVLDGDHIESYTIEITGLHPSTQDHMKGIAFEVSDDALIADSGGIIQGMSGSPIVQNGKIIGAVTHVVTDAPTQGYGVFIEYMLAHTRSS